MTDRDSATCPDAETLAAFVDGRLPRREVHSVLAHLAECDRCARAVAGASESFREQRRRTPAWLTLAAAVVIAIAGAGAFLLWRSRAEDAPAARLVALAPRDARIAEPRLSGGFAWAPYRGPMRASDSAPDARVFRLSGVAGELLERAERDPSPRTQQAAGAALILIDRPHDAAAQLRAAAATQPSGSTIWNDLGAAEYAAALGRSQPSRYAEALAAFDRALAIDPQCEEALFNRALTLERLGLHAAAREAWQRYLRTDAGSPWAVEARERLRRLPSTTGESRFRIDQPRLEAAAARGDGDTVDALVRAYPQASRSFAEAEYLGQWAEAGKRGDTAAASRLLGMARAIGESLARMSGESLLRDAVAVIDRADAPSRASLAEAHAAYRRGRIAYSRQAPAAAEPELRRAASLFARSGSPMALVARYFAANTRFDQNDVRGARQELEQLLTEAGGHRSYHALGAQVRWELALCLMNDDDWSGALPHLAAAERVFDALGERSNRGFIETLTADTLISLGRPDDAWAARIRSFDALSAEGWGDRLAVSLGGAVRMELRGGHRDAARALSHLELETLRAAGNDFSLANALVRAAVVEAELGEPGAATARVDDAEAVASRLADPAMRVRADADVQFARGAVLLRHDPRAAAERLDHAIAAYARLEAAPFLPEAHLLRARAALRLEEDDVALRELANGIAALERHRLHFAGPVGGTLVLEAGDVLYQEAIRLTLDRGDVAAAFAWSERALRQLAPAAEPPADALRSVQRTLAGTDATLVELSVLPEEVVAFIVTADEAAVTRRKTRVDALAPLGEAACRGDAAAARQLYDLLLAPAAGTIRASSRLIVVADPRLEGVPFAALIDAQGQRLIERLPVAVAPAATALRRERGLPVRSIAAAGVATSESLAPLPASSEELEDLARIYGHAVDAGGSSATFAAVLDAAARADVLHISGHSERQGRGGETALVFRAPDGREERVTWRRIALSPLRPSPIVVLAACETLLAQRSPERRTLSLGSGFLAAGAGDVIGTLAPIPDNDARALFSRIHHHLASGHGAAEALRLTQLESLALEAGGGTRQAWRSVALLTRRIDIKEEKPS